MPSFVGISLHYDEVRLLKATPTTIQDFAIAPLPAGSVMNGKIHHPERVTQVIKQLLRETKSVHCDAAIALPAAQVISKQVTLTADLSDAECEADIAANLNYYFPGMNEELSFDFTRLENNNLLLFAARTEQVNQYVLTAQQAGLKVKIADVDQYALTRALIFAPQEEFVALLDLDAHAACLMVFARGAMIFNQQFVWDVFSEQEFIVQLKRLWQLLAVRMEIPAMTKIFLSGKYQLAAVLKEIIANESEVVVELANPFGSQQLAPVINKNKLYECACALLVVFGLLRRSSARW